MLVTLNSPHGAAFDVLDSDGDVPLVPDTLVQKTQDSIVGYEIIEGYTRIVNVQPFQPVEGVPSLKKTQDHARESAQLWAKDTRSSINEVYSSIKQKLKVTQDTAKDFFKELIPNLEKADNRNTVSEALQLYIDDTNSINGKISALISKLNSFRESLEEDARNYGTVLGEVNKQNELDKAAIKKLHEQIGVIDQDIDELNNIITQKKVQEQEIKRKLAISYGFVWSIPGIIAVSVLEGQRSSANKAWRNAEDSLIQKKHDKEDKSKQLGDITKRIAYLTTLNNEFSKLLANCTNSIAVVFNMADAWSTLGSNLENIQQRLERVKDNDFNAIEKIKARLSLQIKVLEKSIDRLNDDVIAFEQSKLIQVPIDEGIDKHILSDRSAFSVPIPALPARLIYAYAQRNHYFDVIKI
ncbi:MAG: HBL/NHE enterotoxin family protein [Cellulomonas sp.]|nr:HBL/NHE enterotoxin family protein [Rickettsiella sp.]